MKFKIPFMVAALFLIVTKAEDNINPDERIIGGSRVSINDFSFMAAIVIEKEALQCGCSIIGPLWVITAAHCIELLNIQKLTKDLVFIAAGNSAWKKGTMHNVADWTHHAGYDNETFDNDIALIKVQKPFQGKLQQAIRIAPENYRYKPGTTITVIGWGVTRSGSDISESWLNGVDVQIINHNLCTELYENIGASITGNMFCAGVDGGGKDACQFDSGGPIFDNNFLIGIVSWGDECGKKDKPGVYTRVNKYINWITKETRRMKAPLDVHTVGNTFVRRASVPRKDRSGTSSSGTVFGCVQNILFFFVCMLVSK